MSYTKNAVHAYCDRLIDAGNSIVVLCVPDYDEGFYRVATKEDVSEEQRINELLEGIEIAKKALLERKDKLNTQDRD